MKVFLFVMELSVNGMWLWKELLRVGVLVFELLIAAKGYWSEDKTNPSRQLKVM